MINTGYPSLLILISTLSFSTLSLETKSQTINRNQEWTLWYQQPARNWNEALPVGNGRLGAMIFGNPEKELIQLNEESLWAGSPLNNNNPRALKNLPRFRNAIFEGDFQTASEIATKGFLGTPPRIRSYEPLGDLEVIYHWKEKPQNYMRALNLNRAVATVEFEADGHRFTQKAWISAPDNVMVIEITSPGGGKPEMEIMLKREKDATVRYQRDGTISMNGQIMDKEDTLTGPGGEHMRFAALARITGKNAEMTATDSSLQIRGSSHITIVLTAATNYHISGLNFIESMNPADKSSDIIRAAMSKPFEEIYQNHLQEYQQKFERVNLTLGSDVPNNLPTDQRLKNLQDGKPDEDLVALYFQYGRYLLLSSSRYPGILPANLQGIWNKDFKAAWNSDFHTNINLQMNYWPAESTNLSETAGPLADFMIQLTRPGSRTAKEMYGAEGWTMHHLTDPFGRTGVADGPWGITPMDGPWMTFPVYRHFLYTGDFDFLKNSAYPLLKGAVAFLCDFLVTSPEGYLVTNPSHSPENSYYDPVTHQKQTLTYAATTDLEIAHALFDYFIQAATFLNVDKRLG